MSQKNRKDLENLWKSKGTFPKACPYKPENKQCPLYTKVLIINSKESPTTFANPAGRGSSRNTEMGIGHKGDLPRDVEKLAGTLTSNNHSVRVDG